MQTYKKDGRELNPMDAKETRRKHTEPCDHGGSHEASGTKDGGHNPTEGGATSCATLVGSQIGGLWLDHIAAVPVLHYKIAHSSTLLAWNGSSNGW